MEAILPSHGQTFRAMQVSAATLTGDLRHRLLPPSDSKLRSRGGFMKAATATTRIQFRNILFATDFSPAAMRAIPIAKSIARNYDSNIIALHVRGPVVNPMTPPAVWPMVLEAEKQKDELRRGELLSYFAGIP